MQLLKNQIRFLEEFEQITGHLKCVWSVTALLFCVKCHIKVKIADY